MSQPTFTDEDLTAYLDGELDAERRDAVDAALAEDAGLSERLAALDFPLQGLKAEGDALLTAVPALSLPPEVSAGNGWKLAASLVIGVLLGAGAMRFADTGDTWVDAVASYQALYVPATLSGDVQPVALTNAVVSAFEAEAGISLDGVTQVEGLTFKRAQTLGIEGRQLLQLAYVTDDGAPVAYCLTLVEDSDRPAAHSVSYGLGAVDWVKDGTGFVLVGDLPRARLEALQSSLPGA